MILGDASQARRTGRPKILRLEGQDGSEKGQGRLEAGWSRESKEDRIK